MGDRFRDLLDRVGGALTGRGPHHLEEEEAEWAFGRLLSGEVSLVRATAFLLALRAKGPTPEELSGCARAARSRIRFPELPPGTVVLSTSRRGKRRSPPLGLAAAAAASACGVPVLVLAPPGTAGGGTTLGDVWVEAGGGLRAAPEAVAAALRADGFAVWCPSEADPGWHPLQEIEEDLGLRLLPDVVAKLLLPEGCPVMVAAMHGPVLGRAGDALQRLGHPRGLILQGVEGSLDPALSRTTRGLWLADGHSGPLRIRPEDLGLGPQEEPALAEGAEPARAALNATRRAFLGRPAAEALVAALGAACILSLAREVATLAEALAEALDALDTGAAEHRFQAALGRS